MLKSRLRPDTATMVGLLAATGVFLIYNDALPTLADVKEGAPHDDSAEKARKHAAWMSAALVAGTFLVARDFNSYILAGGALVAIDLAHKHANTVNPHTGKAQVDNGGDNIASVHPMPEYATQ